MNQEVQKLKNAISARVSSVCVHDANAKRQELSSSKENYAYTTRLAFSHRRYKAEILIGDELACLSIFGQFDLPRLTINSKDRSGFGSTFQGNARIGPHDYEVFTEDGRLSPSQREILGSAELAELIRSHEFQKGEALHVYGNCIVLYLRRCDLSTRLISNLVALAESISKNSNNVEDDRELPSDFGDLAQLLREWAPDDDLERSEKIEGASKDELRRLLALIEPRLTRIRCYLRERGTADPSPEDANLARLAETVTEIKMCLGEL